MHGAHHLRYCQRNERPDQRAGVFHPPHLRTAQKTGSGLSGPLVRRKGAVMNGDISEEAKTALANNAKRKARERLHRDGAESLQALQRRVRALAAERNLPLAEYAKLLHKRILTGNFIPFCKKHGVSPEWLLCGDLRALQRMTQERKAFEPPCDDGPYRD